MALTRVTSKVIQDGTISTADLSTASKSSISGSFRGELSSSVHLRQVASTISGSLGSNASVIRSLDRTTISGSIPQALSTTSSPTFNNITATGTLTAQEIHTEFTSASILFTSGSTIFGNSSDDVHNMTGSLNISGSFNVDNGTSTVNALTAESITTSGNISGSSTSTGSFGSGNFSSGGVGIGTTTTTSDSGFGTPVLRMAGSTHPAVVIKNTSSGGEGLMSCGDEVGLQFAMAGNANASHNVIKFRTGNTNSNFNSTERMRIDSAGSVGFGATPTTFHSTLTGVQIGGNGILQHETSAGASKTFKIAQNVREEITSGDFTYISTDEASLIELNSGGVNIKTAPSGTAGATATMTSRFTVIQDGKVGIGETSPLATLHVKEGDSGLSSLNGSGTNLFLEANGANAAGMTLASGNTANGYIIFGDEDSNFRGAIQYDHSSPDKMHLVTAGSQRLSIDQNGNVGIGTTSPGTQHLIVQDTTVNNDGSSYTGFFSYHIITAGSSDASDTYFGIRNHMEHNQSGQGFGSMYGIFNSNQCSLAAGQMVQVTGISNNNSMESGDIDYMRGILNFNNFDAGEVDNNIVTLYNLTEIASGGTIRGSVYGIENDYDADTDPAGVMYGYYGIGRSNNDYHILTYSVTQSSVTFRLGDNGSIEHEQGISSNQSLDYAEYFESKDGKAIAIGTTVKLDDGEIVACEDGDTPIGVVRPVNTSAVVGGKQTFHWQGMYETDDYGGYVMESFSMTKWEEEVDYDTYRSVTIGDGGVLGGTVKKECYEQQDGSKKYEIIYRFHTDRIPSDLTVPSDARVVEDKNKRKKINSGYDHSKADSYKDREERDEWHIVGLLGQIQITKGQPLSSNWIKMKDVSDTVELYFVK
mgnify:CR=1 FL=1